MRKYGMVFISLVLYLSFAIVNAEDATMNNGYLYVNDILIESENTIQVENQEILFPLRIIFEALGADVDWQKETGHIIIKYNNETYLCYSKEPNQGYAKYFYVKKENTDEYIFLTPMSTGGAYRMINDRTYLYQETGRRLFEAVGCTVEVEPDSHTVKIFN